MRTLTKREKILLAVVGAIGVIFLVLQVLPTFLETSVTANKDVKLERLQTAEKLVQLEKQANGINENLGGYVGLRGRLISDSLFNEISQSHNVETFNRTRQASDLVALHPALEGKAAVLFAYKTQRDGFDNLDELKTIRASIFEGEQPRVVISQRISQLARRSGLKPDYQLNIKPSPGKKTENISRQAKRNFILYSYRVTLENELGQLKTQQEEQSQSQSDRESELERAMFEAWWGGADTAAEADGDSEDPGSQEVEPMDNEERNRDSSPFPNTTLAKNQDSPNTESRLAGESPRFPTMPAVIPMELRMPLIEFILSFITSEINGATEFKRDFVADQIDRVNEPSQRGFRRFGRSGPAVRVRFREDSALLAKFEDLITHYEISRIDDAAEPTGNNLDYAEQVVALTEYVDSVDQRLKRLQDALAKVALTYEPQNYGVDVKFKSDIRTVVKLVELIQTSTKWLYVKNFKLTNDKSEKKEDQERHQLNVELSMIARIL